MDRVGALDALEVRSLPALGGELGGLLTVQLSKDAGGGVAVAEPGGLHRLEQSPAHDLEAIAAFAAGYALRALEGRSGPPLPGARPGRFLPQLL